MQIVCQSTVYGLFSGRPASSSLLFSLLCTYIGTLLGRGGNNVLYSGRRMFFSYRR